MGASVSLQSVPLLALLFVQVASFAISVTRDGAFSGLKPDAHTFSMLSQYEPYLYNVGISLLFVTKVSIGNKTADHVRPGNSPVAS